MHRHVIILGFFGFVGIFGLFPQEAAAAQTLTYRYQHYLFVIPTTIQEEWRAPTESWTYKGKPILAPAQLRIDGDTVPPLPEGFERRTESTWNSDAIAASLSERIVPRVEREAGSVTINKTGSGRVTFDGVGLPGRSVNMDAAVVLTLAALNNDVAEIWLPIDETPPSITVTSPELQGMGITEVVTVGESDFSNSPVNRRHNIAVGLGRFNGHLIPKDTVFSFDETLGPVDASTGYRKELVIKGQRTEPDYGGGLCQVSTTAYRGAWEYGLPITQRKNHSYTVSHYFPQGTDATVYPPNVDMKFLNNTPGALLMQTYSKGDNAYFIYYGTRDERKTDVIGPFIWGRVAPPPPREQKTTEIPPGQRKKVGEAVPGLKAQWYRIITKDGKETREGVFSHYEARPLFHLVGVEPSELEGLEGSMSSDASSSTSSSSGNATSSAPAQSTSSVERPRTGEKPSTR